MTRTEQQEVALKSTHTSKSRRHMRRSISRGESSREDVTDLTNMSTSLKIARLQKWRQRDLEKREYLLRQVECQLDGQWTVRQAATCVPTEMSFRI